MVIKGVNHQIIEVRQTGHPYFERALFFVQPAYSEHPQAELDAEASKYLKSADSYRGLREAKAMRWFKRCALVLSGGFLGTVLGILVSQMS